MEVMGMGINGSSNRSEVIDGDGGGDQYRRDGNGYWTNERHLDFLTSMEATFVRNMMENHRLLNAAAAAAHHHHHRRCNHRHLVPGLENLRLDRYVPDISESTLDLQTTKNTSRSSVKVSDLVNRRHRERTPTHPYKISHDQVVPQAEDKVGDKDEREKQEKEMRLGM